MTMTVSGISIAPKTPSRILDRLDMSIPPRK
jgi:hypothetical protein